MIRGNSAAAHARPAFRAMPFEVLEDRRLMSASVLDNPVVAMDWQGHSVKAEAGEYILALKPNTRLLAGRGAGGQVTALQRVLDAREGTAGFKVEEYLGQAGQFLLDVPQTTSYEQVLATARMLKGFDYVEPNFVFRLSATPNDPLYGYEYGLNNTGTTPLGAGKVDADIDAPEAWDVTTGSADVVVGVVDSGVDYSHPDLVANMWRNPFETAGDGIDNDENGYVDDVHGINAATNSGNPMDDNGHGTHVAGTIAAVGNNGVGVTGVAWNAKIMALKFLAADGSGSTADAIQCLNYAVSMRNRGVNIRLTNNSWGGGGFETAVRNAIAANSSAGILFVAAAGNGGADGVGDNNDVYASYPSNFDVANVVAVAATDRNDALASFSNYGAVTVDLAAPGVDIASTAMGGGYVYMGGTSMATPHVSGVAALAFSFKPTATGAEVRGALLSGADKVPTLTGRVATGGRLNALNTLRALGNLLSGVAYHDADGDGSRGGAEAALAGRTVWLDLDNDAVVDSTEPKRVTDATGAYQFDLLAAGAYTVRQVLPAGWSASAPADGYHAATLAAGQRVFGRDFGSRLATAAADPDDQIIEARLLVLGTAAVATLSDARDVDMFSITAAPGLVLSFDVDRPAGSGLDSYLRVFDSSGRQLGANDNGAAPGESSSVASYLRFTAPDAGTYFVGVSANPNRSYNPLTGGTDVSGRHGAYTLTVSNVSNVSTAAAVVSPGTATALRQTASLRGLLSEIDVGVIDANEDMVTLA